MEDQRLFADSPDSGDCTEFNYLPQDGEVYYYGHLLDDRQARHYFDELYRSLDWDTDKLVIFGKPIETRRKSAWHGDDKYAYFYSGFSRVAQPWTAELLELKTQIEKQTGETFNACLANLYHDGSESMGWHSDAEKEIKRDSAIASLSLGASRKFAFKHNQSREKVEFILENGSLLLMKGATQRYWKHTLPASKKIHQARINLTFRTMVEASIL